MSEKENKIKDKENLKNAKQAQKNDKKAYKTAKNAENTQDYTEQYSKQYGDTEYYSKKYGKAENYDCGCKDDACTCGDNCDCTPEDNCGCGGKHEHHEHKDCGCDGKHNRDENCGCKHNHDGKHEHGEGCGCDGHGKHHHDREEEYAALFAQLQHALEEGEKQLKRARDEAIDNQRLAAAYKKDLERYKERTANIESQAKDNATEQMAKTLLPILDQFEASLKVASMSAETQGFAMIFGGLKNVLSSMGVNEIDAIGMPFDSNIHNAVSRQKVTDKAKDGVVTAVYQKGYQITATGKILRYAMVEIGEYSK